MKQELKDEIDKNLKYRKYLKQFFDICKEKGEKINQGVIAGLIDVVFISFFDVSYEDLGTYLMLLFGDGFLSEDETRYVANYMKKLDDDVFCEESDGLKNEIKIVEDRINKENIEELLNIEISKCKDKYDVYLLQRAAMRHCIAVKE